MPHPADPEILSHPDLASLQPAARREGLIYATAYLTAVSRSLWVVRESGLAEVTRLHEGLVAELKNRLMPPPEESDADPT